MSIYNHRLELIRQLILLNYSISVVAPFSGEEQNLIKMGVKCIDIKLETRGKNPIHDFLLLYNLIRIFKKEKPDTVLTFYTKTNIYGGLAARICGIPYIENITGVGSAISNGGMMATTMMMIYSLAVRKAHIVFFQNTQNQLLFHSKKIPMRKEQLLPGSGVSLDRFPPLPYPEDDNYKFLFISRVLKEKGIFEFVEAAGVIKKDYPNAQFHVIGPYDKEFEDYLNKEQDKGNIIVHGKVFNVEEFIKTCHCVILPSYYGEGMANVLLESASSARPIITTNCPGCGETVDDKVSGYIVKQQDTSDLIDKIRIFIGLTWVQKRQMGIEGRNKMVKQFDRKIVTEAYIEEIVNILSMKNQNAFN